MKLRLRTWGAIAIVAVMLSAPGSASADAVSDWNAIAVQATITGARPGPTGILDVAVVQAAVYDAVQAIERQYEPYYVEIKGASGSPVAAAAKAAHDVLVNRFPAQTASLGATYQQYLLDHGLPADDPGVAVGAAAAAGIIALRACDGSFPPAFPPFIGGTNPGEWRPTPPAFAPMLAPWIGGVTPFAMTRPSQFRAEPHPALTHWKYAKDYNEVKRLGALNNPPPPVGRTAAQTDLANFWNANFLVVMNKLIRDVADAEVEDIGDSARLFALADLAMGDALITAWNSKRYYVFWRPITAIQLGHTDGNSQTTGDPSWLPLIVTPPYPDYTSGANNAASSTTRAIANFLRSDHLTFSVTTTNTGPTVQDTRTYHRLSDAAREVVDARIYQGIHFRFADEEARQEGKHVADWVFDNFLRPLDDDDDNDDDDDDE